MRWELYKDYKGNRNKDYINGTTPDDEIEVYQRRVIFNYLEELYIRQLIDEKVEADDFIAYLCKVSRDVENITVVTSDMDIAQLVGENVRLYLLHLKKYITTSNFKEQFGYHHENIALMKILCGDSSDNIKGVKGLGEGTLFKHFPQLTERKVTLDEIIKYASELQKERLDNKKKKLKVIENIINGITDGVQGEDLYNINRQLIDLTTPLVSETALEDVNLLISSPLSNDRSIKNAYKMLKNDGIDKVLGQVRYETYLLPFKKLMEREKKENIIN
jgi:5'-3' exonuclease